MKLSSPRHFLILILSVALLVPSVASAHDFEAQNADGVTIYYNLLSDTEVAVTYRGVFFDSYKDEYTATVNLPSAVTYTGASYSVTAIDSYAFSGCSGLTRVVIPVSVTSVGSSAFYNSGIFNDKDNWTAGVLYVDDCLIKAESTLSGRYSIKKGTRLVASSAFYGCRGLTELSIPASVTSIGSSAFSGCSDLTEMAIPGSVNCIGSSAFSYCSGMKSLRIKDGDTVLNFECESIYPEYSPFYGCNIEKLYVGRNINSWETLCLSPSLKEVKIGDSVTQIGDYAFSSCSGLIELTIGRSVEKIGKEAFADCVSLENIYAKMEDPKTVAAGQDVFKNVSGSECWLMVPTAAKPLYTTTQPWRMFEHIVEMDFDAVVMGDCNGDGGIDAADIAFIVDYLFGIDHDSFERNAADMNGDGKVDATDISLIIRLILSN